MKCQPVKNSNIGDREQKNLHYIFFQGVFAFRRGTKRNSTNQDAKKKKSRKKRSKPENTTDDVPEFFGKSANAKFRFDLYNQYF